MVLSVGDDFLYLSPSFAVLEVKFRQMRIKECKAAGIRKITFSSCEYTNLPKLLPSIPSITQERCENSSQNSI